MGHKKKVKAVYIMTFELTPQGLKDKGRSMDAMASDETVRKKPRTSFSGGMPSGSRSSDFKPFQYEGKNFSDFARGKHTTTYDTIVCQVCSVNCQK